jgi:hypothetical protein
MDGATSTAGASALAEQFGEHDAVVVLTIVVEGLDAGSCSPRILGWARRAKAVRTGEFAGYIGGRATNVHAR